MILSLRSSDQLDLFISSRKPTVPKGIGKLEELTVLVDADEAFPVKARQAFTGLFDQCKALTESILTFEAEIVADARHDETARRLATIPASVRLPHP